jgi:hypothetical protein
MQSWSPQGKSKADFRAAVNSASEIRGLTEMAGGRIVSGTGVEQQRPRVSTALSILMVMLFLGGALVSAACGGAWRLCQDEERPARKRQLIELGIKGVILPAIAWVVLNHGWSRHFQPLMPQVQAAQIRGGSWVPAFIEVLAYGIFAISSYWAALILGWAVLEAAFSVSKEARSEFNMLCLTSVLGMAVPALIIVAVLRWLGAGLAAAALVMPIAGYAPAMLRPPKRRPMYARAIARIKFGKYQEGEWEIIRELENHEEDYEGWLMLAELYARNFRDVAEAEQLVMELCSQPKVTPSQAAVALHRLADWHLDLNGNVDAARRALGVISLRYPGSHLARMAQLRGNQLPQTAVELQESRAGRRVALPRMGDMLDAEPEAAASLDPAAAEARARELSARLAQNPNDIPAREEFARLLSEQLGHPDQGIKQVELLLHLPGQPEARMAEWMAMIGAWHLRQRQDPEAGRRLMRELIARFPQSPQAFAAQRRLSLMEVEERMRRAGVTPDPPPPLTSATEVHPRAD